MKEDQANLIGDPLSLKNVTNRRQTPLQAINDFYLLEIG